MSAYRFPALGLALLSGAAGLAHQVLWTRRLVDVLGANADTFSKVIGAFFLGLALGAWRAAAPPRPGSNLWNRVARAELLVALLAVPALASAQLGDWLAIYRSAGSMAKVALPFVLVLPPAFAMGLVMPWMAGTLNLVEQQASRDGSAAIRLYAVNTLGGVLGLGAVLWWALPYWGLFGASAVAIALNLTVAVGAWWLGRQGPRAETVPHEQPPNFNPVGRLNAFLAFASGAFVLSLEVLCQQQFAQVAINSLFSSAFVLGTVLLALAVGAAILPAISRWQSASFALTPYILLVAALLCAAEPFLFTWARHGVRILEYELPPLAYAGELFRLGALTMLPLFLVAGLLFPILIRGAMERAPSGGASRLATLFAWNGLGGWVGVEFTQAWLAPRFGIWTSLVILGAAYFGSFLVWRALQQQSALRHEGLYSMWIPASAVVVVSLALAGWLAPSLPQATVQATERLVKLAVGREGIVATLECGPDDWRMLFNNSYTLGGSRARFNQERQALLPMLLHGQPETVAALGVATGGSVAGATLHPGARSIKAVELSPLVLEQARQFFGPYNRQIFAQRQVEFVQEDARWVMARDANSYDVIVGDLFLPWRTGEGRLFTREHFANVRQALKPGGLFCQWLPLFQLTRPQFEAIVRTFRLQFPNCFLVRGDFYCDLPIVGLVGGWDLEQIHWATVRAGCESLRQAAGTSDPLIRHVEGVAMLILGPAPDPGPGPINTLANCWLEWDAGRNILGLQTPWFTGLPYAEFARDLQRASAQRLPVDLRPAHESGQFFLTLDVAAHENLPARAGLEDQFATRTPEPMRTDPGADWSQWPSRVKPSVRPATP